MIAHADNDIFYQRGVKKAVTPIEAAGSAFRQRKMDGKEGR
jgi:hypothetical protein